MLVRLGLGVAFVLGGCQSTTLLAGDAAADDASDGAEEAQAEGATGDADCEIELPDAAEAARICPVVDPTSLGDCATPLGFVFDGTSCVAVSGCACTDPSCRAFVSLAECARACADAGRCNTSMLPPGDYPYSCPADFCDSISFCVSGDATAIQEALAALFAYSPCGDDVFWHSCTTEVPCETPGGYTLAEILASFCPVTLMPGVARAACFIAF